MFSVKHPLHVTYYSSLSKQEKGYPLAYDAFQQNLFHQCLDKLDHLLQVTAQTAFADEKFAKLSPDRWVGAIIRLVRGILNCPITIDDKNCWFFRQSDRQGGYPMFTMTKSIAAVKTNKFFHHLWFPEQWLQKETAPAKHLNLLHSCKHDPAVCCNPYHIRIGSHAENKSDDNCINGAAFLCPHKRSDGSVTCIWTSKDGVFIPCRNMITSDCQPPPTCTHQPNCWTTVAYNRSVEQKLTNRAIATNLKKRTFDDIKTYDQAHDDESSHIINLEDE